MIRNWYNQIPYPALKTKREDFSQLLIKANIYENFDSLPYIEAGSDTLLLSSTMEMTHM